MKTKICSRCKQEKPITAFTKDCQKNDGYRPECKDCKKITDNKSYITHKSKRQAKSKERYNANHDAILQKQQQAYYDNHEQILAERKLLRQIPENKKKKQITDKKYREKNKDKIKKQNNEYRQKRENKDRKNQRARERRDNDWIYKLIDNTRKNISSAFYNRGYTKRSHTYTILGESYAFVIIYLFTQAKLRYPDFNEKDFLKKNMYQIHHKVFLETAKTEEDVIKLNHYTNLELLTVEDHQKIHSNK